MTVWRMRIPSWIPRATNTHTHTHTHCVKLITFTLPQWQHERTPMLRCVNTACLAGFSQSSVRRLCLMHIGSSPGSWFPPFRWKKQRRHCQRSAGQRNGTACWAEVVLCRRTDGAALWGWVATGTWRDQTIEILLCIELIISDDRHEY